MIEWTDHSTPLGARHICALSLVIIDLARAGPREPWCAVLRYAHGLAASTRTITLDALLCDDDAKARALVDALAIVRALVRIARDDEQALAVAVAGARLGA